MADTQTFLYLTNRVLKAFNEVKLDSMTFDTADGFYEEAKDDVNQAIFDIYMEEDTFWPWAWRTDVITTVVGTQVYSLSTSAISVDWDSFILNRDDSQDVTADYLPSLEYKVWLSTGKRQHDMNINIPDGFSKPRQIVRRPDNSVFITTVPDKIYTIGYEYYTVPEPLVNYDDETVIPAPFVQLIIDKALYYAYMFRDNVEQAQLAQDRYERNVNRVRRISIPQFQNVVAVV